MSEQVLSEQQIENEVEKLNVAWSYIPGEGLVLVLSTGSFGEGLTLVNQIASVAEKLNHHPEVTLRVDEVDVTIITHSAGGVTEKDVELARAIDEVTA